MSFTANGKDLTTKRGKPICSIQQIFKATWLFRTYSPVTGDHFELVLSHCNSANIQVFLNEFSKDNLEEFKIIILIKGAFHKEKTLIIPNNTVLFFISPYSPKLNPSEKHGGQSKEHLQENCINY